MISLLIAYLIFFTTATFYVGVMHFKIIKDRPTEWDTLHWSTKAIGYQMLYIGLIFDILLNILVMTVLLLEVPEETLTTSRIKRHYWDFDGGWRHRFARSFAHMYLLPFDPRHMDR
jgi:hypothetical protein